MKILRSLMMGIWSFSVPVCVWSAGIDHPAPSPSASSSEFPATVKLSAPVLQGPQLSIASFFGQPSDVTADWVLGQPDFTSNADTGPCRTRIGYPMGAAYYIRGDSHYLFVADQRYNRILIFDNANNLRSGQPAYAVIGQATFDFGSANRSNPLPHAESLKSPADLFMDERGDLYVADYGNNRVLVFRDPIGTDFAADSVFGQAGSFSSATANLGGRGASSLSGPLSVAVDGARNVYIADGNNNRVLIYFDPLNTDLVADKVLGQADSFASGTANLGGVSASSFNQPYRLRFDPSDNLYVTDINNSRGLIFNNPIEDDRVADVVIGQPNFATGAANTGGRGASSIREPCSLGVDAYANLYMADWGNNRVLFYKRPLSEDTVADAVFGQNDFASADTFSPSALSLWGAQRIDFDPDGNLYISDCYNSRLLKYKIAQVPHKCPVPWITVPKTGKSVSGNAVSVIAHLPGDGKGVTLQFQYRREPSKTWSALGPDVANRPYLLKWKTTDTGWSDGDTVWLRAAAMSADCDTTYSLAVRVGVKRNRPDIEENDGDEHEKREKVEKGRKVTVDVASHLTVDIPPSTLDSDAVLRTKDFEKNPKGKNPDGMANAKGIMYQSLEFESGPAAFKDSVTLTFSYSDSDNDGLIDGTDVPETTAEVYWMATSDTEWKKHGDIKRNPDSNVIEAKVSHFSYYAVFGSSQSSGDQVLYPKSCLITTFISPSSSVSILLRAMRDRMLASPLGRKLTVIYYPG